MSVPGLAESTVLLATASLMPDASLHAIATTITMTHERSASIRESDALRLEPGPCSHCDSQCLDMASQEVCSHQASGNDTRL
jgi:hypothetical protein